MNRKKKHFYSLFNFGITGWGAFASPMMLKDTGISRVGHANLTICLWEMIEYDRTVSRSQCIHRVIH